jgi:hypothetical protein
MRPLEPRLGHIGRSCPDNNFDALGARILIGQQNIVWHAYQYIAGTSSDDATLLVYSLQQSLS